MKRLAILLLLCSCGINERGEYTLWFDPSTVDFQTSGRPYQPPVRDVGFPDAQEPYDNGVWSIPSPPRDAGFSPPDASYPPLPCGFPLTTYMPVRMDVSAAASALSNGHGRINIYEYNGWLVYSGPIQRNRSLGIVLNFPRTALKCIFVLTNLTGSQRAEVNIASGQGVGTNCQCEYHFQ